MIYDRLPGSLKLEENLEGVVVKEGADFVPSFYDFKITSGTIVFSFGSISTGEILFNSDIAPGEWLLGITASRVTSPLDVTLEESQPYSSFVSISGDFLDKSFRPENLYEEASWVPGFIGAELILKTEGSITKVILETEDSLDYEGTVYNPVDGKIVIENITDSSKIVIKTVTEDAKVSELLISGIFTVDTESIDFFYFLQPVGGSLAYEPLDETTNLFLIRYSSSGGYSLVNDLRVTGATGEINLGRILTEYYDNKLAGLYEMAEEYNERYMNYDTAFKGEY